MDRSEASAVPASFAPVVSAFARDQSVTRGKMFSSSNVLSVNGKIFAMLVKGKLVVKLPKQRVDELVAARVGTYVDPGHGRLHEAMDLDQPRPIDRRCRLSVSTDDAGHSRRATP